MQRNTDRRMADRNHGHYRVVRRVNHRDGIVPRVRDVGERCSASAPISTEHERNRKHPQPKPHWSHETVPPFADVIGSPVSRRPVPRARTHAVLPSAYRSMSLRTGLPTGCEQRVERRPLTGRQDRYESHPSEPSRAFRRTRGRTQSTPEMYWDRSRCPAKQSVRRTYQRRGYRRRQTGPSHAAPPRARWADRTRGSGRNRLGSQRRLRIRPRRDDHTGHDQQTCHQQPCAHSIPPICVVNRRYAARTASSI